MKEWMALEDSSAFKALSHPIRVELLRILSQKAASVNDLAIELNLVHAKVHYHVRELVKCHLIEQVDQSITNGIVEKFYRAVAKTFFIGHSIGSNPELADSALTAVEENVLKQRRNEVLAVNYNKLAKHIIHGSLAIKKSHKVLIEGSSSHQELMEALALECRKLGAEGLIRLVTAKFFLHEINDVEPDILAEAPPFTTLLYENIDYWISISTLEGLSVFRNVSKGKMSKWRQGGMLAIEKARPQLKSITVEWPSKEWADDLNLSYLVIHDAFWQALNVPINELNRLGNDLIDKLKSLQKIKLKEKKAVLEFELDPKRPVFLHDGQLNQGAKESFDADLILPSGKIVFAPLESSINGEISVPEFEFRGIIVKDIKLTITEGQITKVNAGNHTSAIIDMLQHKGGFALGSISIGFNPGLKNYQGNLAFSLIKPDAIGLGLGSNIHLGGELISKIPLYIGIGKMALCNL